ncbi:MAG TPA: mycothiol synthase [Nocardioidaceae bacterium]|nr:mycothiol synthase [Nocardioidaceae bacterium]
MPVRRDPPDWEPLVRRVVAEATAADGYAPLNEAALLGLIHHGLQDATLYVEGDGFAHVHDGNLHLVVSPGARRHGIGRALLQAAEGVATAWSHGDHPGARALAASHGFDRTRELWQLRRPAGPVTPVDPAVPIRTFRAGDEQAFLAANRAAFADHPEQGSLDIEGLAHRTAEPWFDPEGFFLAERHGEVVGFHWTKVHPDGTGEVYVVGVTPDVQGLGLGRALVVRGLTHLQPRDITLYVEADNRSAINLYESLGFEHIATDAQYTRR